MITARAVRRLAAAAAASVALILGSVPAGAAAQPEVLEATCVGSQVINYSPGLVLLAERTVQINGATSLDCVSTHVTGGTAGFSTTGSRSCTSATPSSGQEVITWNDGSTSVMTLSATVVSAGGTTVVTKNGTVVSGRFAGDLVVMVLTGPTVSGLLACLTPQGLTQTSETVVLEITTV
jgi:hypothetical protein